MATVALRTAKADDMELSLQNEKIEPKTESPPDCSPGGRSVKGDFSSAQTPDAGKAPPRVHMAIYIRDLFRRYIDEFCDYTGLMAIVKSTGVTRHVRRSGAL